MGSSRITQAAVTMNESCYMHRGFSQAGPELSE